jgi:invasion protein IalB
MRLVSKAYGRTLIAGAVLTLFMTTGGIAQTTQQRQPAPGAAPAAQGQQQPPRPPAIWVVECADNRGRLDCRAGQSVFIRNTGQRLLSVAVRVPPDTKKPVMLLQVPLGVYLPAGASLQIGKDEAKTLPFKGCDRSGCVAEYAITDAEIAAMTKGSELKISVQNQNQQPAFTLTVPVTGFGAAYAKVR